MCSSELFPNLQGLLQLLTEMDGVVGKDDRILVIAATNMKEKLDEALLR